MLVTQVMVFPKVEISMAKQRSQLDASVWLCGGEHKRKEEDF